MFLLAYFVLFALVFAVSHNWKSRHRTYLILAYNFLFVLCTQLFFRIMGQGFRDDTSFTLISRSFYNSVQNLTFDGDVSEWAGLGNWWLETQAWLIVFFAAVTNVQRLLLTIFYRVFAQAKLRLKVLHAKNQTIIVGKIKDAEQLVADSMKSMFKPRIIYIPTEPLPDDNELYKICRIEKPVYLDHLKRRTNYTVVLLPDDDYANLERVHSLNEWVEKNQKKVGSVRVSVFLDNDLERFRDFKADHLDTCVISKEEIAVRSFLEESHPIDLLAKTNSFEKSGLPYLIDPFRMCVIGFNSIGQEFLLLSYENAAFPTKNSDGRFFEALVIDDQLDTKKAAFLTEVPYFAESNEVSFLNAEYNSEQYFDAIKSHASAWKQIVVSTDDTKTNVDIALKLCRTYDNLSIFDNRPQIVVVFHDSYAGAMNMLYKYPNIRIVDVESNLINYKSLIERATDQTAKNANDNYNQLSNRGTLWNNLGTFLEASNRAQALDVPVKRKLFAMSRASQSQTVEFLAKYEHNRWMAFSFAHGWMPLPVSELTPEERANYTTKHRMEKRHICLVPWEELDRLPQKSPGQLKAYDVESVKAALGDVAKI